jgi:FkbM family methyltransferase
MKFGRGADNFILIEPNPFFEPIIDRNLRNARVSGNWEIISAALGASDGAKTTEMSIDPQNLLSASILKNDGFTGQKIRVKALSLSEVLFNFCRCSVMKMDIEGSEFFLMQSEADLFRKADIVFIEVHWNKAVSTVDPVRFFQNLDFSLVFRHRQSDGNELFAWKSKR